MLKYDFCLQDVVQGQTEQNIGSSRRVPFSLLVGLNVRLCQ